MRSDKMKNKFSFGNFKASCSIYMGLCFLFFCNHFLFSESTNPEQIQDDRNLSSNPINKKMSSYYRKSSNKPYLKIKKKNYGNVSSCMKENLTDPVEKSLDVEDCNKKDHFQKDIKNMLEESISPYTKELFASSNSVNDCQYCASERDTIINTDRKRMYIRNLLNVDLNEVSTYPDSSITYFPSVSSNSNIETKEENSIGSNKLEDKSKDCKNIMSILKKNEILQDLSIKYSYETSLELFRKTSVIYLKEPNLYETVFKIIEENKFKEDLNMIILHNTSKLIKHLHMNIFDPTTDYIERVKCPIKKLCHMLGDFRKYFDPIEECCRKPFLMVNSVVFFQLYLCTLFILSDSKYQKNKLDIYKKIKKKEEELKKEGFNTKSFLDYTIKFRKSLNGLLFSDVPYNLNFKYDILKYLLYIEDKKTMNQEGVFINYQDDMMNLHVIFNECMSRCVKAKTILCNMRDIKKSDFKIEFEKEKMNGFFPFLDTFIGTIEKTQIGVMNSFKNLCKEERGLAYFLFYKIGGFFLKGLSLLSCGNDEAFLSLTPLKEFLRFAEDILLAAELLNLSSQTKDDTIQNFYKIEEDLIYLTCYYEQLQMIRILLLYIKEKANFIITYWESYFSNDQMKIEDHAFVCTKNYFSEIMYFIMMGINILTLLNKNRTCLKFVTTLYEITDIINHKVKTLSQLISNIQGNKYSNGEELTKGIVEHQNINELYSKIFTSADDLLI